jgi:hypothetical protein
MFLNPPKDPVPTLNPLALDLAVQFSIQMFSQLPLVISDFKQMASSAAFDATDPVSHA